MSKPQYPPESRSLRAELRAIEKAHADARWHLWLSDAGMIWATSPVCPYLDGSGTTVTGGSTEVISREIAQAEHEWARAA